LILQTNYQLPTKKKNPKISIILKEKQRKILQNERNAGIEGQKSYQKPLLF